MGQLPGDLADLACKTERRLRDRGFMKINPAGARTPEPARKNRHGEAAGDPIILHPSIRDFQNHLLDVPVKFACDLRHRKRRPMSC